MNILKNGFQIQIPRRLITICRNFQDPDMNQLIVNF